MMAFLIIAHLGAFWCEVLQGHLGHAFLWLISLVGCASVVSLYDQWQGEYNDAPIYQWLCDHIPNRLIYRQGELYMTRFYLLGGKRVGWRKHLPINPYLHWIHVSDEDHLHNHPHRFGVSLILRGGYLEERFGCKYMVRHPGSVVLLRRTHYHRVQLMGRQALTLFFAGPRVEQDREKAWNFIKRNGEWLRWGKEVDNT